MRLMVIHVKWVLSCKIGWITTLLGCWIEKSRKKKKKKLNQIGCVKRNDQPIKSMMDGINDFYYFRCSGCKCMETTWLI